ncbi:hypothetical protein YC2023_102287 [Brassica napus]
MPAGSLALGSEPNSGSSSTVGERVVESSQGNKRKLRFLPEVKKIMVLVNTTNTEDVRTF